MKKSSTALAFVLSFLAAPVSAQSDVAEAAMDEAAVDLEEVAEAVAMAADDAAAAASEAIMDDDRPVFPRDPSPVENEWRWLSPAEYPPESFVAGEEGPVEVRLSISDAGKVTGCKITQTSGFNRLDDATCPALMDGIAFTPALDASGKAVPGIYDASVAWRIRKPEFNNFSIRVTFTVEADGSVTDCNVQEFKGNVPRGFRPGEPCDDFARDGVPYRDAQGNPVAKRVAVYIGADVVDVTE